MTTTPRFLTRAELRPDPDALAVARAVYERTHPAQVILFGSRARGDYRTDSDIDLLIITGEPVAEDDRPDYDRIADDVAAARHPQAPPANVNFLTVSRFLDERVRKNTVAHSVVLEGTPVMDSENAGYSASFEEESVNWPDVAARMKDAQDALNDLRVFVDNPSSSDKGVGYMAQQCLEHAYKALIASRGARYPTGGRDGHNLRILVDRAQEVVGADFQVPGREWWALTSFAGTGRYQDEQPRLGDRRRLFDDISAVVAAILNRIHIPPMPPSDPA